MKRRTFISGTFGLLAAPLAAEGQPPTNPMIGFLHQGSPDPLPLTNAFSQGLSETGISEGRHVTIEHRWAEGQYDRLPALAADLVGHRVAVIAAAVLPAALAAKAANAVLYLCSALSGNATGTHLMLDGGRSATGGAPSPKKSWEIK